MENKPKQVLIFNKALNMPSGKLAVQLSHASLGCVLQLFEKKQWAIELPNNECDVGIQYNAFFKKDSAEYKWINEEFTKIVLYVKSEQALLSVYEKAKEKGLNCVLIKDAGHTFFDKPTFTCVGIGPAFDEDLKPITSKLQLFKELIKDIL